MNKAKVRKKSINYVNRFFNTVINVCHKQYIVWHYLYFIQLSEGIKNSKRVEINEGEIQGKINENIDLQIISDYEITIL